MQGGPKVHCCQSEVKKHWLKVLYFAKFIIGMRDEERPSLGLLRGAFKSNFWKNLGIWPN